MSTGSEFEFACQALEAATNLDRLQSRGTMRIALKAAGLEASSVTAPHMLVVLKQVLPAELKNLGIPDPVAICEVLVVQFENATWDAPTSESPETIFERIGGRA